MEQNIAFRAAPSAYVVFSAIFGYIAVISAIAAKSSHGMLLPAIIASAALLASWAWLVTFRVVVGYDYVIYRTLFRGSVKFNFNDVGAVRIESGIRSFDDRFKPFVRLVIQPNSRSEQGEVYINLKVLSSTALQDLRRALRTRFEAAGRDHVLHGL